MQSNEKIDGGNQTKTGPFSFPVLFILNDKCMYVAPDDPSLSLSLSLQERDLLKRKEKESRREDALILMNKKIRVWKKEME